MYFTEIYELTLELIMSTWSRIKQMICSFYLTSNQFQLCSHREALWLALSPKGCYGNNIFVDFTLSDSFSPILPPSDTFSWDPPRTKMCSFLPPGQKQGFSVPPSDRVIWSPRMISSPSCFFNGIALNALRPIKPTFFLQSITLSSCPEFGYCLPSKGMYLLIRSGVSQNCFYKYWGVCISTSHKHVALKV